MKLYEFQAKRILKENGIPVPRGELATSPTEAEKIARDLAKSVVIKAQILVGGRGLAGGIKFAKNPIQARKITEELLLSKIKGKTIHKVLIEEKISIVQELYVGALIDQEVRAPLIMVSSEGGMEIEAIAETLPEKVIKRHVNIFRGLGDFAGRSLAKRTGLDQAKIRPFTQILTRLYAIFDRYDAELVEINPFALTPNRTFVAVDAKLTVDSRASFRHQDLVSEHSKQKVSPTSGLPLRMFRAKQLGLSAYFELDGNIGIITDGAGTGMLTLDLVHDFGGNPANFCELGGETDPELMKNTLDLVLSNPRVNVVLINLIGGLNRMDEMAEGILTFLKEKEIAIPLVIRMTGTLEDVGREMLANAGLESFDDIYDSVERAVFAVRRQ